LTWCFVICPTVSTTACKWDVIIPFEPLWEQYKRIIKSNGAIVLTASQPFTSALVMSNPKMFKYEWIWEKDKGSNFMVAKKQPLKYHENVLIFALGNIFYNPIKKDCGRVANQKGAAKKIKNGGAFNSLKENKDYKNLSTLRFPKSVIYFNTPKSNDNENKCLHPTQKPVSLFEYLIKTYTNEGEMVLDNCAGSGTTAIACLNTNRNYILMEKEEKYFDMIENRIAKWHLEREPKGLFKEAI